MFSLKIWTIAKQLYLARFTNGSRLSLQKLRNEPYFFSYKYHFPHPSKKGKEPDLALPLFFNICESFYFIFLLYQRSLFFLNYVELCFILYTMTRKNASWGWLGYYIIYIICLYSRKSSILQPLCPFSCHDGSPCTR